MRHLLMTVWRAGMAAGAALLLLSALPAGAQTPAPSPSPAPSATATPGPEVTASPGAAVTLAADRSRLTIGEEVRLSGGITPALSGQVVVIADQAGSEHGRATTAEDGTFSLRLAPERSLAFVARWGAAVSAAVHVGVRPAISVRLARVRLFGKALVQGRVRPAHGHVEVRLYRNGRLARRTRAWAADGTFAARLRIGRPGTYRAVAVVSDDDHLPAADRSRRRSTALPTLSAGASGIQVALLERRLTELGYHLGRPDRAFDARTADALIALNKVHGRARLGYVDRSTWPVLARPRTPRPRDRSAGFHLEVDQTKQVLYVVRDGRVIKVLHVSTGAGGATRDGRFTFYRKLAGYSPNRLYYPSYFDGLRAVHGWPEVPTYNASHGCVRVPMWAARWIYAKIDVGDEILIYH